MEDSIQRRYTFKLIANLVSGVVGILLIALVPKALGPVSFGHFSYLQQFFSQLIAFLEAGTSTAFFTKVSAANKRKELISFYLVFSTTLFILLIIFIVTLDLMGGVQDVLPGIPIEYVYMGLLFGYFTWQVQVFFKVSDAFALTVSIETLKVVYKLASLLILFSIIHFLSLSLTVYFYFHYITMFLFLLMMSVIFVKKGVFSPQIFSLKIEFKKITSEFVKFCSPLFVVNTVAITAGLFDIWLLQKISGSTETGFYGLAYAIAAMCFLFTGAMTPIIAREFSKSCEENDYVTVKEHFNKYVPMLYSLAAFFGVFIAFQSENLLMIFSDERFSGALAALIIMAFYPLHQTYGQINSALFFAMERVDIYKNIGILSTLLGLPLSFLFIYFLEWGADGFAWKMVLLQLVAVNVQLYFNVKFLNLKFLSYIKHQLFALMFFLLIAFCSVSILPELSSNLLNVLFSGFLYTLLVMVGVYLLPSVFSTSRNELKTFGKRIKDKFKLSKPA